MGGPPQNHQNLLSFEQIPQISSKFARFGRIFDRIMTFFEKISHPPHPLFDWMV
jgi:hypothetical protein